MCKRRKWRQVEVEARYPSGILARRYCSVRSRVERDLRSRETTKVSLRLSVGSERNPDRQKNIKLKCQQQIIVTIWRISHWERSMGDISWRKIPTQKVWLHGALTGSGVLKWWKRINGESDHKDPTTRDWIGEKCGVIRNDRERTPIEKVWWQQSGWTGRKYPCKTIGRTPWKGKKGVWQTMEWRLGEDVRGKFDKWMKGWVVELEKSSRFVNWHESRKD